MSNFLVYGCYGYTDQLTVDRHFGELTDPNGGGLASKLTTLEGYTCTVLTMVEILQFDRLK